jgi:hypothetical protein
LVGRGGHGDAARTGQELIMRRRTWALLGLGVTVVGIAAAGPKEDIAAEVKALRKQVQALEKRLKALESASSPVMTLPVPNGEPQTVPAPGGLTELWGRDDPSRDLPPGSVRKEINGMSYYVVPIRGASGGATTVNPAAPTFTAPTQ